MAINWNTINVPNVPVGSVTAALGQATNAFKSLGDREFQRNQAALNSRRVDQTDQALALNIEKRDREESEKNALIARQAKDREFVNSFFSNQRSRLDTPRFMQALSKHPVLGKLPAEQVEALKSQYVKSLSPGENIIEPSAFVEAHRAFSSNLGRLDKESDESLERWLDIKYPRASKDTIKTLITVLGKGDNGGSVGGGDSSNAKLPKLDTAAVTRIQDYLQNTYQNNSLFGEYGINVPNAAERGEAISFLASNGITDEGLIRDTMAKAFKSSGAIKEGFDWDSKEGRMRLLNEAKKDPRYELMLQEAVGGSGSQGYKGTTVKEKLALAQEIINSGAYSSVSDENILKALSGLLPKSQSQVQETKVYKTPREIPPVSELWRNASSNNVNQVRAKVDNSVSKKPTPKPEVPTNTSVPPPEEVGVRGVIEALRDSVGTKTISDTMQDLEKILSRNPPKTVTNIAPVKDRFFKGNRTVEDAEMLLNSPETTIKERRVIASWLESTKTK